MELKEFIKTAISDITNAVSDLKDELQNGTVINPTLSHGQTGEIISIEGDVRKIEHINFDIAVVASETTEQNGNIKAGISIFGAKFGGENKERTENVSRITFSIPVVLPSTHVKTPGDQSKELKPQRHQIPSQ